MSFEPELQQKLDDWLAWDQNPNTRKEIEQLVEKKDAVGLRARMLGKLSFGTAGIRARMEAGFARLNDLTVIQTSHGFARYLNEQTKGRDSRGVAIGYDGRFNSKRFAQLATNVFVRNGIKVYLFSEVVPTPVVSYATAKLNCDAGLMITASHNPKEDNGYKAYWGNGAQILAPHDVEICRIAREEPNPNPNYWELSDIEDHPLVLSADSTLEQYFNEEAQLCYFKELNQKSPLKFTYSAFHGVGSAFARRMFNEFGVPDENVVIVKEQDQPDPTFPTVPFPNPEEGLKVLTLSIKTADENGSTIILANDPDADRLQMAEKQKDGSWRVLTGNEMGTLISWWTWKNWRANNPNADLSKVYMLNSAVSSQIVRTMADAEGFKNDVTLTGFKWMGNLADELRKQGNQVILAWEESIGFMPGHTLDKDGVSSVGVFAEIANYLHQEGLSLTDQLFSIYNKYGFHLVRSSYWIVPDTSVTKQLFADLRADLKYPEKIGNDAVQYVRDLTTGYDTAQSGNKAVLPISTSSEMVTFTLASGSIITLRASGTEPKIKYYIELKTPPGKQQSDLAEVLEELSNLEQNVVDTLLKPKHYGLIARA